MAERTVLICWIVFPNTREEEAREEKEELAVLLGKALISLTH